MAVTVKDILHLEIMKDFKVVAGAEGLNRSVSATEILDFEFVEEVRSYRLRSFLGNSVVLSSLLFAKDDPDLILEAVKKLINENVQALAYKPVFFKELPKEALDYADKMDFPILQFGHDEFFEDVIFGIKTLVEKDDVLGLTEPLFAQMIERDISAEEAAMFHEKINPLLRPFVMTVCIKGPELTEPAIVDMIKRGHPDTKMKSKTFVGKFADSFIIILSQDENKSTRFHALLEDVLIAYGLAGRELIMGFGTARHIEDQFDRGIREAYWAEKVAEIEKENVKHYKNMGIYKLITANIHKRSTTDYMEEYLAPIFEEEGKDGELLHTAVEYILAKGDMMKTAERLFCHKNTIRYRIGKLQEKLDPDANEKEFYQDLAAAIKIYLLQNQSN